MYERLLSFSVFPLTFRFDRTTGSVGRVESSAHVLSRNIAAPVQPKALLTFNSHEQVDTGYDTSRLGRMTET